MKIVRRHIEVVRQEQGAVLLDKGRGIYFQVNDLGLLVVEGLANGRDRDEIVQEILREFSVTEERARTDLDTFINSLEDVGLA